MGLDRQPRLKRVLLLFVLPVIVSAAGTAMYEHLIAPAIPFLPGVPFIVRLDQTVPPNSARGLVRFRQTPIRLICGR